MNVLFAARHVVPRVVSIAAVLAIATACASVVGRDHDEPLPVVRVTLEEGAKDDAGCARDAASAAIERREGRVPDDASRVARLRLEADRPVAPRVLDDVAAEWCVAHCMDGFALLVAEEEPGGGRTAIEIWTYRRMASEADPPR